MENADLQKAVKSAKSIGKKGAIALATAFAVIIGYSSATLNVDSGETVRVQNSISGDYEWIQKEGIHMKVPFFSEVAVYNSVSTIAITDDDKLLDTASATRGPLGVTFADNYGGHIEVSFRAKLPTSDKQLEAMHQDVKSQTNLEGNTYLTFAKDMVNLTTDQFLAQDFMQGGKGAFKQRLQEQADLGMRVTKREKVPVFGHTADQGTDGKRSQAATAKQFVYKVVSQKDANGNLLRRPHSLTKYGITITQTDLGEFNPADDLRDYIDTIKKREKESAARVAEQKIERERAISEQLKGDRERITAKNKALMEKDREVIQGQKQVELATIKAQKEVVEKEKDAQLSKIDKQRELDIATANEGIQKANERAAKYEAQSILHKGKAKAEVLKATYKARDPQLYALEKQVEITANLKDAFTGINVTMPTNMIVTGGAEGAPGTTSVDTVLQLLQLDKLDNLAPQKGK